MFDFVLYLFLLVLLGYFFADAAIFFAKANGSLKQRLLVSGRCSPIIISSRFISSVGAGVNSAAWLADVANASQISQAITTYLPPKSVTTILIAVVFKNLGRGVERTIA